MHIHKLITAMNTQADRMSFTAGRPRRSARRPADEFTIHFGGRAAQYRETASTHTGKMRLATDAVWLLENHERGEADRRYGRRDSAHRRERGDLSGA
jgi:hypothetical protein